MNGLRAFGVFLIVISILILIPFSIYDYYCNYQYERDIGSHMDNAYDMNTPSRMITELELAKKGMVDAGLKESDYGAIWFKKPDNSMAFQYQHIDSIIERAYAVEEWYTQTYGKGSNSETLGDVYEQKMDNLRDFIREGVRSDWIADDAWFIKNHTVMYFDGTIVFLLTCLLTAGLVCATVPD